MLIFLDTGKEEGTELSGVRQQKLEWQSQEINYM